MSPHASTALLLRRYLVVVVVVCFLCTWMVSYSCYSDNSSKAAVAAREESVRELATAARDTGQALPRTYLAIIVLSSPGDSATRVVVRDTWMRLSKKGKDTFVTVFPLGTANLSLVERNRLEEEQAAYGDLAFIEDIVDSYSNLTRKTLKSMQWVHSHYKFQFMLKVDSDSFVRLGPFLSSLQGVAHPLLYWGFLDGRAVPKRKGQWSESDWILCDRYLPYMLGGGYVLAYNLVDFIAKSAHLLKIYKNEDVAVGTWLAGLNVKYVPEPRFDTEFRSRGCSNEYLITHKKTSAEMLQLYSNLVTTGRLCEKEFRSRGSYVYDFSKPPSQCCLRSNSSKLP